MYFGERSHLLGFIVSFETALDVLTSEDLKLTLLDHQFCYIGLIWVPKGDI